jgi:membrane protease YdiL (CAAX protease family)
MTLTEEEARPSPNWKQVTTFLGLTFGLTYLLDLVLYLTGGYGGSSATLLLLQVQMLIPACVAIVLQVFVYRESPIYHVQDRTRWFFYGYLVYALIQLGIAVSAMLISNQTYQIIASALIQLLLVVFLLLLVLLRLVAGKDAFQKAGLAGGKFWYYISFGLLLATIYAVMTGLNALFGLGQPVNVAELLAQAAGGQTAEVAAIPNWLLLVIVGVQAVVLGPVLALPIAFGEEYGWRGYLQGELIKIGKVRGILLVGVIWGLWHAPIIAMGHNYPGYPVLGIFLMTLYTIALGFLFGYAVLKSGSVWLAAFLHGLNNQVAAFLLAMIYRPADPVFAFGLGLYGLIVWAIVVAGLLLLDRKSWASPAGPPTGESQLAQDGTPGYSEAL